jgi:hypothetical protein
VGGKSRRENMKKLSIKSDSCLLEIDGYNGTTINGKALGKMVRSVLPEGIKEYSKLPVKFNLTIEFLGEEGLEVEAEGYELPTENKGTEEAEE